MNRLTARDKHSGLPYYEACFAQCDGNPDFDKCLDCSVEFGICQKLCEYEDAGLEPEDIKRVFTEQTLLKMTARYLGTTPERIVELVAADKEGRRC